MHCERTVSWLSKAKKAVWLTALGYQWINFSAKWKRCKSQFAVRRQRIIIGLRHFEHPPFSIHLFVDVYGYVTQLHTWLIYILKGPPPPWCRKLSPPRIIVVLRVYAVYRYIVMIILCNINFPRIVCAVVSYTHTTGSKGCRNFNYKVRFWFVEIIKWINGCRLSTGLK